MNRLIAPNVAEVPQYSPLRYPGGKSRFYPFIKIWIKSRPAKPKLLIEPFAGGAHIGLAAAIENLVEKVVLVEKDEGVAAVWQTIVGAKSQWLIDNILSFKIKELNTVLKKEAISTREKAFQVLIRNRISRGGVTAPGAGVLHQGEGGKGVASRWYPQTLANRIEQISTIRKKIQVLQKDGLKMMKRYRDDKGAIFFIDPPYPVSGKRLYRYYDVNPEVVFDVSSSLSGDFLLTYEDTKEIRTLISKHKLDFRKVYLSTTHHQTKVELIISKDLSWLSKS